MRYWLSDENGMGPFVPECLSTEVLVGRRWTRRVHPGFHNQNLLTFLNGHPIALAKRHAKVRRKGYRAVILEAK